MRYKVDEKKGGIDITVSDVKNDKQRLLEAFRECQEGRCSCPTDEYKKLDALEIAQQGEDIQLHLKSKVGETIDKSEIEKCLNYTEINGVSFALFISPDRRRFLPRRMQ